MPLLPEQQLAALGTAGFSCLKTTRLLSLIAAPSRWLMNHPDGTVTAAESKEAMGCGTVAVLREAIPIPEFLASDNVFSQSMVQPSAAHSQLPTSQALPAAASLEAAEPAVRRAPQEEKESAAEGVEPAARGKASVNARQQGSKPGKSKKDQPKQVISEMQLQEGSAGGAEEAASEPSPKARAMDPPLARAKRSKDQEGSGGPLQHREDDGKARAMPGRLEEGKKETKVQRGTEPEPQASVSQGSEEGGEKQEEMPVHEAQYRRPAPSVDGWIHSKPKHSR